MRILIVAVGTMLGAGLAAEITHLSTLWALSRRGTTVTGEVAKS